MDNYVKSVIPNLYHVILHNMSLRKRLNNDVIPNHNYWPYSINFRDKLLFAPTLPKLAIQKKSNSIFVCKWIMFWKVWQMSVDKPTDITSLTIRINILFIFWLFSIFCMQMNHGYFNFVSELCFETGLIQQQEKKVIFTKKN